MEINYYAESFNGVSVEYTNGEVKRFTALHFRIDDINGGDPHIEIIAISVPNVVSSIFLRHFDISTIESLQLVVVHELSHWADKTEKDEDFEEWHFEKWNRFIISKVLL